MVICNLPCKKQRISLNRKNDGQNNFALQLVIVRCGKRVNARLKSSHESLLGIIITLIDSFCHFLLKLSKYHYQDFARSVESSLNEKKIEGLRRDASIYKIGLQYFYLNRLYRVYHLAGTIHPLSHFTPMFPISATYTNVQY